MHKINEDLIPSETRYMFGRRVIKSSVSVINKDNVAEVLQKALNVHWVNRSEIDYLWKYYKGKQPVLNRIKKVRADINNKISVNHAYEIVSFKTAYLCGEPIQYVSRSGENVEAVNALNEMMFSEDKASKDQEIVEWQNVCGTAYRMVLPDEEMDDAPYEMYTLDPRDSLIVYSTKLGGKRLMSVNITEDDENNTHYSVYTDKEYFHLVGEQSPVLVESKPHALGCVPVFEYPANNARLGAFEVVLPLLDAINNCTSNRLDGVEQTIQAFIKFINCDINKETYEEFLEMGAIKVNSSDGKNADVDVVTTYLDQLQTQTLKEDLYNAVLQICGLPSRNNGGTSDVNGTAVFAGNGFYSAEARAKDSENIFKRSEKEMLKLVLRICADADEFEGVKVDGIKLKDIELKFTRRNYENIQSKAQVLTMMLSTEKVHPLLAFTSCGMFSDPESAYLLSKEWMEQQEEAFIDEDFEEFEEVEVE